MNIKPKLDKPTKKQEEAIFNMQSALGFKINIPASKRECSELINSLKETISNNLNIAGVINVYHLSWEGYEEDDFEFLNNIF